MLRERDLIARVRRTKKPETLPAVVEAATKAPFPARLRRPSSQKARGPLPHTGLKNLGNTCFLNATLQCLFGCAEFCSGFVERQYPLAAKSPAQGKIAMAFAELLGDIAQDKSIVSPSNLRKSLTKIAPQFRGNGQHDSQELLRCLLDGLAEDLKRPPPPSPVTLPRQENTEIVEEAHCEAWRAYINANASPVSDHFAGLLRSTVECCSCHCKSVRYDPYLDLSLPLPPPPSNVRSPLSAKLQKGSTSCTLEECLQRFTAVEDLTEKITCERCKKPRKSKKSLTLQTWHRAVWTSNFMELRLLDGVEDNVTHWLTVTQAPHPGPPRQALLVHGDAAREARHARDVQCMNQILAARRAPDPLVDLCTGDVPDGGPRPESVRVRGPAERAGRLRPLRDDGSSGRFRCGGALRRAPEE